MITKEFTVANGILRTNVSSSKVDPELLFDVAERPYSRRPYLLISRPAGRQIPIKPSFMNDMIDLLLSQITDIASPVLVIGMAEGGIAPGANFHRKLQNRSIPSYYTCSTRMRLDRDLLCQFEEVHKWALPHKLYLSDKLEIYENIKTIVIFEDEITTGNTTMNLIKQILDSNRFSNLKKIMPITFTDWSDGAIDKKFTNLCESISLMTGSLNHQNIKANEISQEVYEWKTIIDNLNISKDWGRFTIENHRDCLLPQFKAEKGSKILVVATTEYAWPPFILADRLEKQGADVEFIIAQQNTLTTGKPIKSVFTYKDNYGLGINYFLYNIDPAKYNDIIYCAETPLDSIDNAVLNYLDPILALDF